ncbi:MAG: hypothetical protein KatS3mg108_2611 [Isosphaeraceae bacterium]|jgi:hypothetical protein|nr:MAG: hypothetical protein KatS3mg108_2611 [Isosphaeraceae bacterium]
MVAIYHWVIDGDAPFDAITEVLEYLWDAELTDYENRPRDGHIFEHLVKLANWLNSGVSCSPHDYVDARKAGLSGGWRTSATYERPDGRPKPGEDEHRERRTAFLAGGTLDVSEAAKEAGFTCPVAVTACVYEHLIAHDWAFDFGSEEKSLAHVLRVVADAYAKEGRDVYTWLYAVGGQGEPQVFNLKALHRREAGRIAGLTIMMSWEEDV